MCDVPLVVDGVENGRPEHADAPKAAESSTRPAARGRECRNLSD